LWRLNRQPTKQTSDNQNRRPDNESRCLHKIKTLNAA